MIVYWVGHMSLEIETRQVAGMTETNVLVAGANGIYRRRSRSYGGQQYFATYDDARQFILDREREKIAYFEKWVEHYRQRLQSAPPALTGMVK